MKPAWLQEPFKSTEIGEIPESWYVVPLGSLLRVAQYGLSLRGEKNGRYPILRMNCQEDGRVVFRDLQFVDLDEPTFSAFKLHDGDLLFNRTNSIELVGRTAIFHGTRDAVFASYLIRLRADEDRVIPEFLNHFLNFDNTQSSLKALATRGVSQSNISASKLKSLSVVMPPRDEQQALAVILSKIQAAAEVQERIVATLKDLKAATMAELFREGLRGEPLKQTEIGEVPESWQIVSVAQITESSAFGPRFSGTLYDTEGNVATLRTTDIEEDGRIHYRTMPTARLNSAKFEGHFLRAGDLVITRSGTCGVAAIFESQAMPVLPGAFLIRVRLSKDVSSHFLRLWINSPIGRPMIQQLAVGAVQKNISGTSLATLRVPLPERREQEEIAERLVAMERRLSLAERRRDSARALFNSMLRLLMMAQLRVRVEPDRSDGAVMAVPELVECFVSELVRRFEPERVIQFGERAEDSPKAFGEVGLLVEMDFAGLARDQAARIAQEIAHDLSLDVVVRRPEDVRHAIEVGDGFIGGIVTKGKVLYARPAGEARRPRVEAPARPRPRRVLSEETLAEIVRRIVEAAQPERIVLFGSAARGEMGPDSDVDLLVVKGCSDRREAARTIRERLIGVAPGLPKDVIVVTPEEVDRHRDTIGLIIRPALREGRVVYAR